MDKIPLKDLNFSKISVQEGIDYIASTLDYNVVSSGKKVYIWRVPSTLNSSFNGNSSANTAEYPQSRASFETINDIETISRCLELPFVVAGLCVGRCPLSIEAENARQNNSGTMSPMLSFPSIPAPGKGVQSAVETSGSQAPINSKINIKSNININNNNTDVHSIVVHENRLFVLGVQGDGLLLRIISTTKDDDRPTGGLSINPAEGFIIKEEDYTMLLPGMADAKEMKGERVGRETHFQETSRMESVGEGGSLLLRPEIGRKGDQSNDDYDVLINLCVPIFDGTTTHCVFNRDCSQAAIISTTPQHNLQERRVNGVRTSPSINDLLEQVTGQERRNVVILFDFFSPSSDNNVYKYNDNKNNGGIIKGSSGSVSNENVTILTSAVDLDRLIWDLVEDGFILSSSYASLVKRDISDVFFAGANSLTLGERSIFVATNVTTLEKIPLKKERKKSLPQENLTASKHELPFECQQQNTPFIVSIPLEAITDAACNIRLEPEQESASFLNDLSCSVMTPQTALVRETISAIPVLRVDAKTVRVFVIDKNNCVGGVMQSQLSIALHPEINDIQTSSIVSGLLQGRGARSASVEAMFEQGEEDCEPVIVTAIWAKDDFTKISSNAAQSPQHFLDTLLLAGLSTGTILVYALSVAHASLGSCNNNNRNITDDINKQDETSIHTSKRQSIIVTPFNIVPSMVPDAFKNRSDKRKDFFSALYSTPDSPLPSNVTSYQGPAPAFKEETERFLNSEGLSPQPRLQTASSTPQEKASVAQKMGNVSTSNKICNLSISSEMNTPKYMNSRGTSSRDQSVNNFESSLIQQSIPISEIEGLVITEHHKIQATPPLVDKDDKDDANFLFIRVIACTPLGTVILDMENAAASITTMGGDCWGAQATSPVESMVNNSFPQKVDARNEGMKTTVFMVIPYGFGYTGLTAATIKTVNSQETKTTATSTLTNSTNNNSGIGSTKGTSFNVELGLLLWLPFTQELCALSCRLLNGGIGMRALSALFRKKYSSMNQSPQKTKEDNVTSMRKMQRISQLTEFGRLADSSDPATGENNNADIIRFTDMNLRPAGIENHVPAHAQFLRPTVLEFSNSAFNDILTMYGVNLSTAIEDIELTLHHNLITTSGTASSIASHNTSFPDEALKSAEFISAPNKLVPLLPVFDTTLAFTSSSIGNANASTQPATKANDDKYQRYLQKRMNEVKAVPASISPCKTPSEPMDRMSSNITDNSRDTMSDRINVVSEEITRRIKKNKEVIARLCSQTYRTTMGESCDPALDDLQDMDNSFRYVLDIVSNESNKYQRNDGHSQNTLMETGKQGVFPQKVFIFLEKLLNPEKGSIAPSAVGGKPPILSQKRNSSKKGSDSKIFYPQVVQDKPVMYHKNVKSSGYATMPYSEQQKLIKKQKRKDSKETEKKKEGRPPLPRGSSSLRQKKDIEKKKEGNEKERINSSGENREETRDTNEGSHNCNKITKESGIDCHEMESITSVLEPLFIYSSPNNILEENYDDCNKSFYTVISNSHSLEGSRSSINHSSEISKSNVVSSTDVHEKQRKEELQPTVKGKIKSPTSPRRLFTIFSTAPLFEHSHLNSHLISASTVVKPGWQARKHRAPFIGNIHESPINACMMDLSGRLLVTVSNDGTVHYLHCEKLLKRYPFNFDLDLDTDDGLGDVDASAKRNYRVTQVSCGLRMAMNNGSRLLTVDVANHNTSNPVVVCGSSDGILSLWLPFMMNARMPRSAHASQALHEWRRDGPLATYQVNKDPSVQGSGPGNLIHHQGTGMSLLSVPNASFQLKEINSVKFFYNSRLILAAVGNDIKVFRYTVDDSHFSLTHDGGNGGPYVSSETSFSQTNTQNSYTSYYGGSGRGAIANNSRITLVHSVSIPGTQCVTAIDALNCSSNSIILYAGTNKSIGAVDLNRSVEQQQNYSSNAPFTSRHGKGSGSITTRGVAAAPGDGMDSSVIFTIDNAHSKHIHTLILLASVAHVPEDVFRGGLFRTERSEGTLVPSDGDKTGDDSNTNEQATAKDNDYSCSESFVSCGLHQNVITTSLLHCVATAAYDSTVKLWDMRMNYINSSNIRSGNSPESDGGRNGRSSADIAFAATAATQQYRHNYATGGDGGSGGFVGRTHFWSRTRTSDGVGPDLNEDSMKDRCTSRAVITLTGHVNNKVKVGFTVSSCLQYFIVGSEDQSVYVYDVRRVGRSFGDENYYTHYTNTRQNRYQGGGAMSLTVLGKNHIVKTLDSDAGLVEVVGGEGSENHQKYGVVSAPGFGNVLAKLVFLNETSVMGANAFSKTALCDYYKRSYFYNNELNHTERNHHQYDPQGAAGDLPSPPTLSSLSSQQPLTVYSNAVSAHGSVGLAVNKAYVTSMCYSTKSPTLTLCCSNGEVKFYSGKF